MAVLADLARVTDEARTARLVRCDWCGTAWHQPRTSGWWS
jgi:hypothetical protein